MKKIIALILAILPISAMASEWTERDKPVTCGPFREIVETLIKDKYREFPLWIGKSSQDTSQFSLFLNETTGAWTLVQYGRVTGCILGMGESSDIVNGTFLPKSQRF